MQIDIEELAGSDFNDFFGVLDGTRFDAAGNELG